MSLNTTTPYHFPSKPTELEKNIRQYLSSSRAPSFYTGPTAKECSDTIKDLLLADTRIVKAVAATFANKTLRAEEIIISIDQITKNLRPEMNFSACQHVYMRVALRAALTNFTTKPRR